MIRGPCVHKLSQLMQHGDGRYYEDPESLGYAWLALNMREGNLRR